MSRALAALIVSIFLFGCAAPKEAIELNPTSRPSPSPSPTAIPFELEIVDPLSFVSGEDTLVGRLYLPISEKPVPAVVMVHGSGRRTRDESVRIATELAEAGIAVFRYDKRGVGDSEGRYSGVGPSNSERLLLELALDAIAAVEFIQQMPEINSLQVGVLGNSQAGWIMPIAASQSQEISFAVLIVGPAVSVAVENFYSALTGQDAANTTSERLDEISADLADFEGRGFDPRESITQMDIPAIWILGGRDESIPTRETITILEEIREEYDKDFTIHLYPDATHNLVNFETGEFHDFIEEIVLEWIFENLP
jgi:hypothetical protein